MQTPPETSSLIRKSAFRTLFPQPTGENGYEDLLQASEILDQSADFPPLDQAKSQPSLAQISKALATPEIALAVKLIRSGANKPILSPHTEHAEVAVFPEFALLPRIARLIAAIAEADFAHGDASSAIAWLDLGFRFAHAIQHRHLQSMLMGTKCEGILMARSVERISSLSKPDCIALLKVVQNRLDLPAPSAGIIQEDFDYAKRVFMKIQENPLDIREALGDSEAYNESDKAILARLEQETGAPRKAVEQASAQLNALMNHAVKNAEMAPWKRMEFVGSSPISVEADFLLRSNIPHLEMQFSTSDQIEAQYRLFATRLLLRLHHWDNDRHPESLVVFKDKAWIEDPFSGKPFEYKLTNEGFELSSIGPHRFDEEGKPTKERSPVYLPLRR